MKLMTVRLTKQAKASGQQFPPLQAHGCASGKAQQKPLPNNCHFFSIQTLKRASSLFIFLWFGISMPTNTPLHNKIGWFVSH
jgi:hypothetical protein